MNHRRMKRGDVLNGNSHIALQPRFDLFFSATLAMKSYLRIAVGFSIYNISYFFQIHSFLTRGSAEQGCGETEGEVILTSRPKHPRGVDVSEFTL